MFDDANRALGDTDGGTLSPGTRRQRAEDCRRNRNSLPQLTHAVPLTATMVHLTGMKLFRFSSLNGGSEGDHARLTVTPT